MISQILQTKRPDVVVISPEDTLREAIATMVREDVGALVVVDDEQSLMGVVSEREIILSLDTNVTLCAPFHGAHKVELKAQAKC